MSTVHHTLDRARDEIRIFTLESGRFEDGISGRLDVYPIGKCPTYEALSYCWGSPLMPADISISEQSFSVHGNLYDALRFLRYTDTTRALWIDAICIDQSDQQERLHQVQIMASIYSRASVVLVWLGPPFEGSGKVMDLIEQCGEAVRAPYLEPSPAFEVLAPHVLGFLQLLQRDYWFRIWIVQEVAMARGDPLIGCGSKWMVWPLLWYGLLQARGQFRNASTELYESDERSLYARCAAAMENFFALDEIRRTAKNEVLVHQPRPLPLQTNALDLLWKTSDRQASDPRDRIYSLLGVLKTLSSDKTIMPELDPDYARTARSVFIMATKMVIRLERNLEVLHMRNHHPASSLPSWTPDFSSRIRSTYPALASAPHDIYHTSIACRFGREIDLFKPSEVCAFDDQETLIVSGRRFDTVTCIVDLSDLPTTPHLTVQRIDQAVGFSESDKESSRHLESFYTLEAIWRTLVADTSITLGTPCSRDYAPAYCMLRSTCLPAEEDHGDADYLLLQDFIADVKLAITSRDAGPYRKFVVTERGRFGLGPPDCQIGDHLCIFKNFSMPAVLRDREKYHTYVGTAYVHGVMRGEEYGYVGDPPEHFHLR